MPGTHAHVTDWVAQKCLRLLTNGLISGMCFDTSIEKEYKKDFQVGDTVYFKYPDKGTFRNDLTYVGGTANRRTGSVVVDQILGMDLEFDSLEMLFERERSGQEVDDQYFKPRIAQLIQRFELLSMEWIKNNASQCIGAVATTPTTLTTYNGARTRLSERSLWDENEVLMIVTPEMMATVGNQVLPYFKPDDEVTRFFKKGSFGKYAGMRWFESMSLPVHTIGTAVTGLTTNGGGQSGNTLSLNATTGQTVKKGDKFAIDGVYAVNEMTGQTTRRLREFTVLNDATAASSAFASGAFTFSPSIIGPGSPYQNVDALPGATVAVTLWPGTTSPSGKIGPIGLAVKMKDFAFRVSLPLPMPKKSSVEEAYRVHDPDTDIGISIITSWDNINRKMITRLDLDPFGFGVKYSDGAVCIGSAA